MAKIKNNTVLDGVSGMIGDQIVIRQTEHGAVMAARPAPRHRDPTPAQKAQHDRFRAAVMYAKSAASRPEYQKRAAAHHTSAHNVATADFLHPPEVYEIDLERYHGKAGDVIEVRVFDDVEVQTVGILIATDDNVVVEKGVMKQVKNDPTKWVYTATQDAGAEHVKVIVDAADLAKQVGHGEAEKGV